MKTDLITNTLNLIRLIAMSILLTAVSPIQAAEAIAQHPVGESRELTKEMLEKRISIGLNRVQEYAYIKKMARDAGVRLWLFGDSAVEFAQYARLDLLRELGDHEIQSTRLDYDLVNINVFQKEIQLVAEGKLENIKLLEAQIRKSFPGFHHGNPQWRIKVRHGHELDSPIQNFDTYSSAMLELTDSSEEKLFEMSNLNHQRRGIWEDLIKGELSLLLNGGEHYSMLIEYLVHLFQYRLSPRPEDQSKLERLAHDWNVPNKDKYLFGYNTRVRALYEESEDTEYSWNFLEKIGLRSKLIEYGGGITSTGYDTLAGLINKEPLRSLPIIQANELIGEQSAKSLDLVQVAHETKNVTHYFSMVRSHRGRPNVFKSRSENREGHAIVDEFTYTLKSAFPFYGTFYTMKGDQGGAVLSTGYTIRMKVNPDAVLNRDFIMGDLSTGYPVFENKNALTVENINPPPLSLREYLDQYRKRVALEADLKAQNKAAHEIQKLKLRSRIGFQPKDQIQETLALVDDELHHERTDVFNELLGLYFFNVHPENLMRLISQPSILKIILQSILTSNFIRQFPESIDVIIQHSPDSHSDILILDYLDSLRSTRPREAYKHMQSLITKGRINESVRTKIQYPVTAHKTLPEYTSLIDYLYGKVPVTRSSNSDLIMCSKIFSGM